MIRLSLCILAFSAPAFAEGGVALPNGFDGVYATEGLACDNLGRVEVRDGVMVGAEFAMTVTDLIEIPGQPNQVEATLFNEGGGGEWTDSAKLTLADDGQSLRFDYPDGAVAIWTRCEWAAARQRLRSASLRVRADAARRRRRRTTRGQRVIR